VRRTAVLTLLLFVLAGLACDDSPDPGPGTLTITLVSPNALEGVARLRLVGPGMGAVSALEGEVHVRTQGDTLSVLVMRAEGGILRFLLQVEDTTRKPRGAVVQVAGPDNVIRPALMGYAVEVTR